MSRHTKLDSSKITKSKYNLRDKRKLKKNKPDPESESDSDYESEDDSNYETIDEEEESDSCESSKECSENSEDSQSDYNSVELRKYLSKIFPSKYMSEKVKKDKQNLKEKNAKKQSCKVKPTKKPNSKKDSKVTKKVKHDSDDSCDSGDSESDSESVKKIMKKLQNKKKNTPNKKKKTRVDYENNRNSDSDSDSDSDYSSSDEKSGSSQDDEINIVFKLGNLESEYYEEFYNEKEMKLDNEKEECDSEDEKMFMKEKYQEISIPTDPNDKNTENDANASPGKEDSKNKAKNSKKMKKSKKCSHNDSESGDSDSDSDSDSDVKINDVEEEYMDLIELKKHLTEKLQKKPHSKLIRNSLNTCKDEINKLVKSARFNNTKSYYKLIHKDKKYTNEIDYFKKKLSNKEQIHIVNDLKEINKNMYVEKPYRLSLLQSSMPPKLKAVALQKLNMLKTMEPGDPEYHKIKNWVDTFMKIPFGVHKNLSICMSDGKERCSEFIKNAKQTLDQCVYGLEDAKMQIMQMLGQWIANPASIGSAIAIKGPPGTGKTSLIKDGVSKILGREFAFIALGGAGDSSFLEGHSYTYEGSTWGKIVQILIDSKCMNPVIYFDELDKISNSPRGQEIIGILTHLIDTSQNSQYHDKYFSEVDFDLSKCLFIFSYNDETLVNPILKDRMYCIQTSGYQAKEKVVIAKNYLLPKIREQVNFNESDIIIPDETINHIISTSGFTNTEDGVRNLKRCLEIIHTKLNLFRLVDLEKDSDLFKQLNLKVTFPFTVTKDNIDIILKSDLNQRQSLFNSMYI